jgi:hypothetical protein
MFKSLEILLQVGFTVSPLSVPINYIEKHENPHNQYSLCEQIHYYR